MYIYTTHHVLALFQKKLNPPKSNQCRRSILRMVRGVCLSLLAGTSVLAYRVQKMKQFMYFPSQNL